MGKQEESQTNFTFFGPTSGVDPILLLETENEQTLAFAERLKWIRNNKVPCFFISPHLDDAIYSAGSLISFLTQETDVNILTLFTKANHQAFSEAAKRWLKASGHEDAEEHYRLRNIEDEKASADVGASSVHLGFVGTIWRRENITTPMLGYNPLITPEDEELITQAQETIQLLIPSDKPFIIFGPIAVGGHIDHILTREIVGRSFNNIIRWVDFPYSQNSVLDKDNLKVNGLSEAEWRGNSDRKVKGILGYESQNKANFQNGVITLTVEHYYFDQLQNPSSSLIQYVKPR